MSDSSDTLPPLREVIKRLGLSARKSLGQNYLMDFNLTRKIARAVPALGDSLVMEIGPGPGGLTRALLLEGAGKVVAIEKDERFQPALEEIKAAYPDRFSFFIADATKFDPRELPGTGKRPIRIAANLPYNVGTHLLVGWMSGAWPPWFSSLTILLQREVAERIIAKPGTSAYGRLSILAQWRAAARIIFDIPATAFTPQPKVQSSLVEILAMEPLMTEIKIADLSRVTAAAFGQRRKMLRSSLKSLFPDPESILRSLDIMPEARPEQLSIEDFLKMARELPH